MITEEKLNLPPIADDVLEERMARVTPLINRGGKLHSFAAVDPRNTAFNWDPKGLVEVTDYAEHSRSRTHHKCGYHAFFKPSIAEVLAQLPDDPEIAGFYIDEDLNIDILHDGDGHAATTVWLRRA